jgi:hypothetical protein
MSVTLAFRLSSRLPFLKVMEKIKNYTSSVPVDRTVNRIESFLVAEGAKDIMKNYNPDKELEGLSFRIERHNKSFSFRLPASVYGVARVLYGIEYHRLNPVKKAQAQRTAWKCVSDWVELQMAMVKMQQADFVEVFLPYLWIGEKTYYKSLLHNNFGNLGNALPPHG